MDPELINVATGIAQVILTGLIAWVVHRSTGRIANLEFSRSLRETWIGIDALAVADPATLAIADSLLVQHAQKQGDAFARKRWFILAYLNPIATTFQGAQDGMFGSRKQEMLAGVRAQLDVLMADEDAYWVSQNHGHEASFQRLCSEAREAIVKRAVPVTS